MSGILSKVERAYCLVLDKRWEYVPTIVENFNKLDLWHKARLFICGNGSNPNLTYDHIDLKENPPHYVNSTTYPSWWKGFSAYNAWLCHNKILKEAYASGYASILLTEDDSVVEDDFFEILSKVESDLEKIEWDMLYFSSYHYPGSTLETNNPNLLRLNGSGGWSGVIMKRNIIAELVHNFGLAIAPYDYICGHYLHSIYNCYAIYPSIISQRDNIFSYVEGTVLQKPSRFVK